MFQKKRGHIQDLSLHIKIDKCIHRMSLEGGTSWDRNGGEMPLIVFSFGYFEYVLCAHINQKDKLFLRVSFSDYF